MTLVRAEGAFKYTPGTLQCVQDHLAITAANASAYSPGATALVAAQLAPTLAQNWSIVSVSFQAYVGIGLNGRQMYGRLGKVIGGLVLDVAQPTVGAGQPYNPTLLPLPSDSSMSTVLYDGENDPMPPSIDNANQAQPNLNSLRACPGSVALPVPKAILGGSATNITLGVWITPSLIGCPLIPGPGADFRMLVYLVTYSIAYDNGVTPGPQP